MKNKTIFSSTFLIFLFFFLISPIQKNINLVAIEPPTIVFEAEPELMVISGTYVYYISKDGYDLFFYQDFRWRPWNNSWYRSETYSGPWVLVNQNIVPLAIIDLPADWRAFPPNIILKWDDVRWHWREWEYDRYWDNDERKDFHHDKDGSHHDKDDSHHHK